MVDVLHFLLNVAISCVISLGWCLMFTLPKRYIALCLLMTALAYTTKTILLHYGTHLAVATFFATMASSFLGVHFAQQKGLPPKALIVPSVIFLMPGIVAYKAMVSMVQIGYFGFNMNLFVQMMTYFFEATFVISALVLGLSVPGILFYRKKPIV